METNEFFWKIPKKWVEEWHLSPLQCLLLADIEQFDCTINERAKRLSVSRPTVYNAIKKIVVNQEIDCKEILQKCKKSLHFSSDESVKKVYTDCKKSLQKCKKSLHSHIIFIKDNKIIKDNSACEETDQKKFSQISLSPNDEKTEIVAKEFFEEVVGDTEISMHEERLFNLPKKKIGEAVLIFEKKLLADGRDFIARSEFRRYFNNWLKINALRIFENGKPKTNNTAAAARDDADYIASIAQRLHADGVV